MIILGPPRFTLFPYTTLFRSNSIPGDQKFLILSSMVFAKSTSFWPPTTWETDSINAFTRSEEHTSELQSHSDLVCRLLLEKKKQHDHHHPLQSRTNGWIGNTE